MHWFGVRKVGKMRRDLSSGEHEREILLTLSRLLRKKCISASRGTMITDSASD